MVLFHNRLLVFHIVHHSLKGNQPTEHGLELPKLWAQTTFPFCLTFSLFLSCLTDPWSSLEFLCARQKYSTTELYLQLLNFSLYIDYLGYFVIVTESWLIQKAWPSNDIVSWIFYIYFNTTHMYIVLPRYRYISNLIYLQLEGGSLILIFQLLPIKHSMANLWPVGMTTRLPCYTICPL